MIRSTASVEIGYWIEAINIGDVASLLLLESDCFVFWRGVIGKDGVLLWFLDLDGLYLPRLFHFALLSALLFLICIVGRRNLQNLLYYQVIVLKYVLVPLLEGGQSPENAVQQFGVDPDLGHPCRLRPFLISFLKAFIHTFEEVVVEAIAVLVQRFLGVVAAEEQIYL
jgi:hypothetical protein